MIAELVITQKPFFFKFPLLWVSVVVLFHNREITHLRKTQTNKHHDTIIGVAENIIYSAFLSYL